MRGQQTEGSFLSALIAGVGVMVVIGMIAFTVPTLRVLRIMPTEALREGG